MANLVNLKVFMEARGYAFYLAWFYVMFIALVRALTVVKDCGCVESMVLRPSAGRDTLQGAAVEAVAAVVPAAHLSGRESWRTQHNCSWLRSLRWRQQQQPQQQAMDQAEGAEESSSEHCQSGWHPPS